MATSPPPTADHALEDFATNAVAVITPAPTVLGLTSAQATALSGFTTDYVTKLGAATEPTTRTKVTIALKNTSKASLLANLRLVLRIVDAFPGTSDAQRESLGMRIPDRERTPLPPPATQPVVNIAGSGGGLAEIRLRDETTPDKKAKPAGVFGALVATAITNAADPAPAFDDGTFNDVATRGNHTLTLPPNSAGKKLWVQARWMNERGQRGPASVVTSALIAA